VSEDLFGNPTGGPADPAPGAGGPAGGSLGAADHAGAPLAVRLRPRTVDEIVGQQHLLGPGSPLRRLASGTGAMSVFLWGPPGVGKTTIAAVVSQSTRRRFVEVSAVTAGVKEVRAVLERARRDLVDDVQTVLFVDEVHRFSKSQQDVLLPAVENRIVTLIAATTENPSFSVISPLLSRSLLLTLRPLTDEDLTVLVDRALSDERGLRTPAGEPYQLVDDARADLLRLGGGDARRVLTYLEESAAGADAHGTDTITGEIVAQSVDKAAVRYDKDGDQHYDVISAFIKSIRGSDVNAALHYLARMIEAGEDPRFIARRLIISAAEDIGLADPTALPLAVSAMEAVSFIGMPEGRIPLAEATVHLALAPKSNAAYKAVDAALADVRAGRIGQVPGHLRDTHYPGAEQYGHGQGYRYAHDEPHAIAPQQYLPDELVGADYYHPTPYGAESRLGDRLERINDILRSRPDGG